MVIMGRIVAPYGIYGWLKIQPDTEMLDGLLDYPDWWLGREGQWQKYEVETARVHSNTLLVKLKGVTDRDAAFAFKGKQVAVPRQQLPEPEENAYYWSDLIGLQVKNLQDVDLGKVAELFETGANDVMVIKGEREHLLPFIAQVVLDVNLDAGTMLVDWDAEF
jgi:16S rRNA processing protein RimM